jgi:hypothetical protein
MLKWICTQRLTGARLTRNPVPWLQYAAWCAHWWMWQHQPRYPRHIQAWARRRYGERRMWVTRADRRTWGRYNPTYIPTKADAPLPWWIGRGAMGPFLPLWEQAQRLLRRCTGGRSHRCEFTGKGCGALWGYHEGPFMERLFDQFLGNISPENSPDGR